MQNPEDGGARLREHRDEVLRLAARYGARNVRVFGPVARGEALGGLDLELLVEMAPERSMFDVIALEQDIIELLRCNVTVISEAGLMSTTRDRILAEAIPA